MDEGAEMRTPAHSVMYTCIAIISATVPRVGARLAGQVRSQSLWV